MGSTIRTINVALIAGWVFLSHPGGSHAQGKTSWQARYLEEAPRAWDEYRARVKRLQGSYTFTIRFTSTGETKVTPCEFKQREGCALFLNYSQGVAVVQNPRYGFELRRETPDSQWIASRIDLDLKDGISLTISPYEAVEMWSMYPINFVIIASPLLSPFKDPGFKVKRVTPVVLDGAECCKVEFGYRIELGPRVPSFIAGSVTFDPARLWVIRALEARTESAAGNTEISAAYEYEGAKDGFPILKRVTHNFHLVGTDANDRTDTIEFDLKEADVPEREFTLAAFGFPEPGEAKRTTPWFLWLALGGFACLILAAFFRWRARRSTQAAA